MWWCLPVASFLSLSRAQISCITSSFLLSPSHQTFLSPLSYSFFLLSPSLSLALFKVTPSLHNLFPLYVHIPFWAWNMTRECVSVFMTWCSNWDESFLSPCKLRFCFPSFTLSLSLTVFQELSFFLLVFSG